MQATIAPDSLLNRFSEAMNSCSLSLLGSCFTEDAEFTNVQGKRTIGRTGIQQSHEALFAPEQISGVPSFYGSQFKQELVSMRFIKADVAAIDLAWAQSGVKGPDGQEWSLRKGLINAVAVQQDGAWLFLLLHNMIING